MQIPPYNRTYNNHCWFPIYYHFEKEFDVSDKNSWLKIANIASKNESLYDLGIAIKNLPNENKKDFSDKLIELKNKSESIKKEKWAGFPARNKVYFFLVAFPMKSSSIRYWFRVLAWFAMSVIIGLLQCSAK